MSAQNAEFPLVLCQSTSGNSPETGHTKYQAGSFTRRSANLAVAVRTPLTEQMAVRPASLKAAYCFRSVCYSIADE